MAKKIIDVPDNADYITADEQIDAGGSFLLQKYNVADLPDAPDKRVIELPADVIAELKNIKEDNGDDNLQGFMNDVNDDDELYQGIEGFSRSGMPTDVLLGEWWLGHVEFAPKNESKFRIRFVDVFSAGGNDLYLTSIGNNKFGMTVYANIAGVFTEEEADKIIADVSNSSIYLTARRAKVE